jgi:hypothetical protein
VACSRCCRAWAVAATSVRDSSDIEHGFGVTA